VSVVGRNLNWRDTQGFNSHGDPVLTIQAVGIDDVYRLAHHMEQGQIEFCRIGNKAKAGLKRKLGQQGYASLLNKFHGAAR
jgi:hypothetical protein